MAGKKNDLNINLNLKCCVCVSASHVFQRFFSMQFSSPQNLIFSNLIWVWGCTWYYHRPLNVHVVCLIFTLKNINLWQQRRSSSVVVMCCKCWFTGQWSRNPFETHRAWNCKKKKKTVSFELLPTYIHECAINSYSIMST